MTIRCNIQPPRTQVCPPGHLFSDAIPRNYSLYVKTTIKCVVTDPECIYFYYQYQLSPDIQCPQWVTVYEIVQMYKT